MPWLIGIDEAGYGPNLGPLVMTSVAFQIPPEPNGVNLWHVLAAAVRGPDDPADDRLLIADSKKVYSSTRGLLGLEVGALAPLAFTRALPLAQLIEQLCPAASAELRQEAWYAGDSPLPLEVHGEALQDAAERFDRACRDRQVARGLVRSVVICPRRFNQLVDDWGSKGAVLGHGLAELLRANLEAGDGEAIAFHIDKHGGRNTYAAMLQDAVPDSFVAAHEEGLQRSVYSILGQEREVRLTFQPRADAEHFCVALASMISKYLREVLMLEFNRFWRKQVPGLKPTAGYPADAVRFFEAIRAAAQTLGLDDDALWRKK
jgi:ribonuclease HII